MTNNIVVPLQLSLHLYFHPHTASLQLTLQAHDCSCFNLLIHDKYKVSDTTQHNQVIVDLESNKNTTTTLQAMVRVPATKALQSMMACQVIVIQQEKTSVQQAIMTLQAIEAVAIEAVVAVEVEVIYVVVVVGGGDVAG